MTVNALMWASFEFFYNNITRETGSPSSLIGLLTLIFPPGFLVALWIIVEPLFGVIEGVSAGLFLIGMLVAVVALFICRRKVR